MKYSLSQIIADTRLWTGHNREDRQLIAIADPYTLTLDELILSKVELAARDVVSQAPPQCLMPGQPVCQRLTWPGRTGRGMALLPLPDDFLRLLSVRLSDWHRPARIITDDDPASHWQSSPFIGVRGNPARPVAVVTATPAGRVAELYSSMAGPSVSLIQAQYVPCPRISGGFITLPEPLYHDVVARIAHLTMQSFLSGPISGQQCDSLHE